jgi:hypothetical protein
MVLKTITALPNSLVGSKEVSTAGPSGLVDFVSKVILLLSVCESVIHQTKFRGSGQ